MTLISFWDTRPPAGGRGDDVHVHDGVDLGLGDDLADHRVADVGAHELGAADVAGRDDVDADDADTEGSWVRARANCPPR